MLPKEVLIILAALIATTWVSGQTFEEAKVKAEQGDAAAQFNLGVMYSFGDGVLQDDKEAVRWYRKSAEQGVAEAQYNLGVISRR